MAFVFLAIAIFVVVVAIAKYFPFPVPRSPFPALFQHNPPFTASTWRVM